MAYLGIYIYIYALNISGFLFNFGTEQENEKGG